MNSCSVKKAFAPKWGNSYTHAYLAIGGNDVLNSCTITESEVTARIAAVVDKLLMDSKTPNL